MTKTKRNLFVASGIVVILLLAIYTIGAVRNNAQAQESNDGYASVKVPVSFLTAFFENSIADMSEGLSAVGDFVLGATNRASSTITNPFEFQQGIYVSGGNAVFDNGVRSGDMTIEWEQITMAAATNTVTWQNETGATTTIEYADWGFASGTASGTLDMLAFATSTPSVQNAYNYAAYAPVLGAQSYTIFNSWGIATSTTGTTTSTNLGPTADIMPNGTVEVPPNWYVHLFLQDITQICDDLHCSSATSTDRGYNPRLRFRYIR